MKCVVVLCLFALLALVSAEITPEFLHYAKTHGKVYESQAEMERKALIYAENVAKINEHNANPSHTWKMGINQFTDWNEEERMEYLSRGGWVDPDLTGVPRAGLEDFPAAPASWDWRQQGAINPVRDQGQCGYCWAFASVSAMESAYFVQTKKLVEVSESQQVACDNNGGSNEAAFEWSKAHQPCSLQSYHYECPVSSCKQCSVVLPKVASYTIVHANDSAVAAAVYQQPVAIGIAASGDFMSYSSGIYNGNCSGGRNHAVVIVGYGADFFILRNSWTANWGEAGYMRIIRRANGNDGKCLCTTDPSFPRF